MEGKNIRNDIIIIDDKINQIKAQEKRHINMETVITEDVEAFSDHRIEQYVNPKLPDNIPQKIVTRKLSERAVYTSKTIDLVTAATAVITSAVCSILGAGKNDPAYQQQLTVISAIIGGICGSIVCIKSIILDALKDSAKSYNKNQCVKNSNAGQQIETVETVEDLPGRKVVNRKLSNKVVAISKLMDVITTIAAVTTGVVCSILGSVKDDPSYKQYLTFVCAVVTGICGCIGTVKSKVLDALKSCAKEYNAEQAAK